ncbi:MAG: hypothetical protein ACPGNV_08555 [Mangrovicoccus sp.]
MCFAPCDVARFDFACDGVSEKSPYDLGRYIAGMRLPQANMGALIAACVIVRELDNASGAEMLRGATSASALKCSRASAVRKTAFDAVFKALPPYAEEPSNAWETAHYLAPVIFYSREPKLVAAFFAELLGYRDSTYDDFCFALFLIDGVTSK